MWGSGAVSHCGFEPGLSSFKYQSHKLLYTPYSVHIFENSHCLNSLNHLLSRFGKSVL
uniref:Uncharacterized protein n=1 Tax=Anguilla anguilla TaxID=7936 RepID=A0A0E9Q925_ANGAN